MSVTPLLPTTIRYRDHDIELEHRDEVNDWKYTIDHVITTQFTAVRPRYDSALKAAKDDIDIIMDGKRKKRAKT